MPHHRPGVFCYSQAIFACRDKPPSDGAWGQWLPKQFAPITQNYAAVVSEFVQKNCVEKIWFALLVTVPVKSLE
jgi:hypothetical protein